MDLKTIYSWHTDLRVLHEHLITRNANIGEPQEAIVHRLQCKLWANVTNFNSLGQESARNWSQNQLKEMKFGPAIFKSVYLEVDDGCQGCISAQ